MHKLIKKGEFTSYLTKNKEKTNKEKETKAGCRTVREAQRPRTKTKPKE